MSFQSEVLERRATNLTMDKTGIAYCFRFSCHNDASLFMHVFVDGPRGKLLVSGHVSEQRVRSIFYKLSQKLPSKITLLELQTATRDGWDLRQAIVVRTAKMVVLLSKPSSPLKTHAIVELHTPHVAGSFSQRFVLFFTGNQACPRRLKPRIFDRRVFISPAHPANYPDQPGRVGISVPYDEGC